MLLLSVKNFPNHLASASFLGLWWPIVCVTHYYLPRCLWGCGDYLITFTDSALHFSCLQFKSCKAERGILCHSFRYTLSSVFYSCRIQLTICLIYFRTNIFYSIFSILWFIKMVCRKLIYVSSQASSGNVTYLRNSPCLLSCTKV